MRRTLYLLIYFLGLSLRPGFADVDWPYYSGNSSSTKFAAISQIDSTNFGDLRMVWRRPLPDAEIMEANEGVQPRWGNRSTPIVIDGVMYASTPLNVIMALDAATGEQLWRFDPKAWAEESYFRGIHRGVSYWTDGEQSRVIFGTSAGYLYALDAGTGQPDGSFGDDGRVDLTEGLGRPVERWAYGNPSPPMICRDVVVIGSAVIDWRTESGKLPELAPPGDVRGFDVRTGQLLWTFHAIPREGEFGADSWEEGAWKRFGAVNVWSIISADEELGYVYLPFSTPSNDFYGGDRPGDNLFGDSIVCLNVETGERVWHYQLVHHGLWDYDVPAAPILMDIVVDGRPIKAVAQLTKQGFCFVFDRVTGEPVWPIDERPVPPSTVPGERASATQPFPTWPLPFDRQGVSEDDLIDFTPELKAAAVEILNRYDHGPVFTPPSEKGAIMLPGTSGGAHWGGAAAHPDKAILFVPSISRNRGVRMVSTHGPGEPFAYGAEIDEVDGPEGLNLIKPPYGRVTAIDLNTGEHLWMRALGKGPVNHPALRDLQLPDMGETHYQFAIATPTLVLAGPAGGSWSRDFYTERAASIQALDPTSGRTVGSVPLPRRYSASPITYETGDRQYIVVPMGWGRRAELAALAIPRPGEELPLQLVERSDADHDRVYDAVAAFDAGDAAGLAKLLATNAGLLTWSGFPERKLLFRGEKYYYRT